MTAKREPYQIACKCGKEELLFCVINDGRTVVVVCPACTKDVATFQAVGPLPSPN